MACYDPKSPKSDRCEDLFSQGEEEVAEKFSKVNTDPSRRKGETKRMAIDQGLKGDAQPDCYSFIKLTIDDHA
jgi:hypothetical protein